jgi:hypothetical protein
VLRAPAKIAIRTTASRVSALGAFTVSLSCSHGSADCAGSLTLSVGTRKIASARFMLVAGRVKSVKMTLTRTGRRRLASAGHHGLRAAAVATTKTNTSRRSITLADRR